MEPSEHFSILFNDTRSKVIRVATEWGDQSFKISVLSGKSAGFAQVTQEYINELAEQHEMDPTLYLRDVRKYICEDQANVTFDVIGKQFIIYRTALADKLRLKYFLVKLEKISYETAVELFIDNILEKYNQSVTVLDKVQNEKIEAITQKILLERKCEEFAELKRKSDLQMYSAFTLLLNQKKRRIQFLTELLEFPNKKNAVKNETVFNEGKREVMSDSESNKSVNYNTDDEKQAAIKDFEPIPSTSKSNFDFLGGDSPPPVLPKRIKTDDSNQIPYLNNVAFPNNEKKEEPMIVENAIASDDEADYACDTQELLDRM